MVVRGCLTWLSGLLIQMTEICCMHFVTMVGKKTCIFYFTVRNGFSHDYIHLLYLRLELFLRWLVCKNMKTCLSVGFIQVLWFPPTSYKSWVRGENHPLCPGPSDRVRFSSGLYSKTFYNKKIKTYEYCPRLTEMYNYIYLILFCAVRRE